MHCWLEVSCAVHGTAGHLCYTPCVLVSTGCTAAAGMTAVVRSVCVYVCVRCQPLARGNTMVCVCVSMQAWLCVL